MTASGLNTAESTIPELARLMVGRAVNFKIDKAPQKTGPVVLRMEKVTCLNDGVCPRLNVSLDVRAGEIVALPRWWATASANWRMSSPGCANVLRAKL